MMGIMEFVVLCCFMVYSLAKDIFYFIYSVAQKIYFVLASPFQLDHEKILIGLADGLAKVLTTQSKKEKNELQNLEEIKDRYQKLYKCATEGRLDLFVRTLDERQPEKHDANHDVLQRLCKKSHLQNTFLHIAVSFGHINVAAEIIKRHPPLLLEKNFQGDTALHLAAKAGNLEMLETCLKDETTDTENPGTPLLRMKNDEGNTALHEALIGGHKLLATSLFRADRDRDHDHDHPVSFSANKEGKSPLYLAVESPLYLEDIAILINNFISGGRKLINNNNDQGGVSPRNLVVEGKSPWHAAILSRRDEEILERLSGMRLPTNLKDEKGRTPLHYAASTGFLQGVRFFLGICPSDSHQADNSGFFPIHSASSKGHVDIVKELLRHCPASKELPNSDGQNIFHVAAKCGKHSLVSYFLREGNEFQMLINHKDKEGNTPLHLATIYRHPRVVKYLTWEKRTNLMLLNNKGMTALDIAESTNEAIASFHGRLTWVALKSAGAKRAQALHVLQRKNGHSSQEDVVGDTDGHVTLKRQDVIAEIINCLQGLLRKNKQGSLEGVVGDKDGQITTTSQDVVAEIINSCCADRIELQFPNKKSYKDRVNTLLVVTTLVATVTFAAGFTMPGGYNNSDPNEGEATLLTKLMFQVFVICNTLAMYSSIFVAITLIWAQVGDVILVFSALRLVMPLLGIALTMLSLTFMAGVYVVVSNLRWLSIVVLVIGIVFLYTVLILFTPLFIQTTTPKYRYITYYPFYLAALLASGSNSNDLDED